MQTSSSQFLQMACEWAFEHGRCFIEDDEFLPLVRRCGLSDDEIQRNKAELGSRGVITNHHVIGGMRDFDLAESVFLQYVRTQIPPETLRRAEEIYSRWMTSPGGPLSANDLTRELGVSDLLGLYIFQLVTSRS